MYLKEKNLEISNQSKSGAAIFQLDSPSFQFFSGLADFVLGWTRRSFDLRIFPNKNHPMHTFIGPKSDHCLPLSQSPAGLSFLEIFFSFLLLVLDLEPFHFHIQFSKKSAFGKVRHRSVNHIFKIKSMSESTPIVFTGIQAFKYQHYKEVFLVFEFDKGICLNKLLR